MSKWIAFFISLVAISTPSGRKVAAKATLYLAEQVADKQQHHMLSQGAFSRSLIGGRH